MSEQQYVVIENTPGYMPDDDDPFVTDDYDAAVAYANERADELVEHLSAFGDEATADKAYASASNLYAIYVTTDRKHDLGRWIAVEFCYDDEGEDA